MSWITEALFPRRCPVCREIVPWGSMIHGECVPFLEPEKGPRCMRCGRGLLTEGEYCRHCGPEGEKIFRGVIGYDYGNPAVRELIYRVKYHNERQYLDYPCREMAILYHRQISLFEPDFLVPVPIHPARRRKRGFNQAEEIAVRFGKVWGLPVRTRLLYRQRKTAPQKELGASARLSNLMGAFAADSAAMPEKARIVLVDDIYTTGSTVLSCAAALKKAGAEAVFTAVLAGGKDTGE